MQRLYAQLQRLYARIVIIMPLRGPNWLSQVWHWPEQLSWGQSVAKQAGAELGHTQGLV